MKKLLYLCLVLSFFSCKKSDQPSTELAKIVGDYYEEQLKLNPGSATANGDNRYNDQLNIDFTDSHRALVNSVLEKYQQSLAALNREDLNANDQITYDLLTRDIKLGLEGLTYPDNLTPLNQFYGFHLTFAQLGSREIIKGQIISEATAIDNVTVFNVSSNKGAVTDKLGFFTMYARPSDTLVFSSVIFKSKKLVLNENDFKVIVLKIKLEEFINELDEVIVELCSVEP